MSITRQSAIDLDSSDALSWMREAFIGSHRLSATVYMDGNSLGRPPAEVRAVIAATIDTWEDELIIGWRDWIKLPQRIGGLIAKNVVQADPSEITVGDSTTVSLYKLASAALDARPDRRTIVTTNDNFPTDIYVLQSLAEQRSLDLEVLHVDPIESVTLGQLAAVLNDDTALVCLSHVAYRSGALLPMSSMVDVCHEAGALVLWDVSHSAGSVEVPLHASHADLAVGCSYKYLNGGPGAPAFSYVRADLQQSLLQPIWGWFGHEDQFEMLEEYSPADGMRRFLAGAPSVLSTVAMEPGIRLLGEAGIGALRAKARGLTSFLIELGDVKLAPHGFTLATPRDPDRRGAHVAYRHVSAKRLVRELISQGIVLDFRPPDLLRLGPAPSYTRYVDVWDAVDRLEKTAVGLDGLEDSCPAP